MRRILSPGHRPTRKLLNSCAARRHNTCTVEAGMVDAHLSDFDLEDYAQGTLTQPERRRIEKHAWACDTCLKQLMIAALSLSVENRIRRLMFEEPAEWAA